MGDQMCAALMDLANSSTEQLHAAVARKLKKFGSVKAMPDETRELILAGQRELERRRTEVLKRGRVDQIGS